MRVLARAGRYVVLRGRREVLRVAARGIYGPLRLNESRLPRATGARLRYSRDYYYYYYYYRNIESVTSAHFPGEKNVTRISMQEEESRAHEATSVIGGSCFGTTTLRRQ